MKFLIDNQLPSALCRFLSENGHDTVHVFDVGMAKSSDLEISEFASREARAIIARDEDFSVLAAMGQCAASVIWVRFGNCRTKVLLELFSQSLNAILQKLESGDRVIQILK